MIREGAMGFFFPVQGFFFAPNQKQTFFFLAGKGTSAVCENMKMKGVVCPVHLRQGLFTVGALDNLDHNPSSTTAKDSFHGTGISLFQFPTKSGKGQSQDGLNTMFFPQTKKYHQLPDKFTTVPAVALQKTTVAVPKPPRDTKSVHGHLDRACEKERQWFEHAIQLLGQDEMVKGDVMAWSAFHASLQDSSADLQAVIIQLLPLFSEKAATAARVKHGMNVAREAAQFLNPGQIPVIALDAPLYALAKLVQWHWPRTHGEDR